MTIPAGMLSERVEFISNDGATRFTRKAHVNSYGQSQDMPEYSEYSVVLTCRYDSSTKTLTDKWRLSWEGREYEIRNVVIRKDDRLIDIRGG